MEDERIVELYLMRDENAISDTAEKYGARLRTLAMSITEDRQTAEECENDTYMQAWSSIPPHEPRDYLYAFLARITRHLSLNCCRHRQRLKRHAFVCELSREMEECLPAPDDAACRLEQAELHNALNTFLGTLSTEKRNLFVRRYWYLDSVAAIAARFGITQSKVKTTLFRLREQLRRYLQQEGYEL